MPPNPVFSMAGKDFLPPAAGGSWIDQDDTTSEMMLGERTHSPREEGPLGSQGIDFQEQMMQTEDLPKFSPILEDEKLQDCPENTPSGPPKRPSGAGLIEWRFRGPPERVTDQGEATVPSNSMLENVEIN